MLILLLLLIDIVISWVWLNLYGDNGDWYRPLDPSSHHRRK